LLGRSSGGGVVAHGPGTVNVSIVVPWRTRTKPSIDDAYRLWIKVLDRALRSSCGVAIEARCVEDAFCSGRYDAVAAGRKLAGTAQARRRGSVLVHGTVLADVIAEEYCELVEAAEERIGITRAARLDPGRIVSLRELAGRSVPSAELSAAVGAAARRHGLEQVSPGGVTPLRPTVHK
jgi:lipoate-protein ligase A